MLGGCDERGVGVVVAEVDVGFVLDSGIEPSIVDSERDKVNLLASYCPCCDGCILGLEI